jgi:diguanylate cyclase (GGDEF)-like protein
LRPLEVPPASPASTTLAANVEQRWPGELAGSDRAGEELAKRWILDLVEQTPLADLPEIRVSWLARHGPPLIGEILAALADTESDLEERLGGDVARRMADVAALYRGDAGLRAMPRHLASLQARILDAQGGGAEGGGVAAARRLAEAFGIIQAATVEALTSARTAAGGDPLTSLPGRAELEEWLHALVGEYRRYGHPFAVLAIEVDGLERISGAYGSDAADRMLAAVAGVIGSQIRAADRAFLRSSGEFCVLAPHHAADGVRPLAERLIGVVGSSQEDREPRLRVAIGVASCPDHAETSERLLEVSEEAAFAAKADGFQVALAN